MRKVFWIPIVCIYSFSVWCFSYWHKVLPNTFLESGLEISRLDESALLNRLNSLMTEPVVELVLSDRVVYRSYADLGLVLDQEALTNKLYTDSNWKELTRLSKGLFTFISKKTVTIAFDSPKPILILPVEEPELSRTIYDSTSGKFTFDPPRHDDLITMSDLIIKAQKEFGKPAPQLTASSSRVVHADSIVNDLNSRLASTASQEIVVRVKDGKDYHDVTIFPQEIRAMLTFSSRGDTPVLDIDPQVFQAMVESKLTDSQKAEFQIAQAYPNTVSLLNNRFVYKEVEPVVLGIDNGPTSDGSLADRYIEVDISQQKMYFFAGGAVYKEYRVSTGYDYPTPPGEYHILNKAPKAFSDIYDVWMEYWMAFSYANDIGAYLGIHEIAYALDERGQHLYKLGDYIGEPKTGGCIALRPVEAKEVYDLASVGMLVRVVK